MKYETKLYDDEGTLIAKVSSTNQELHESELHRIYDIGRNLEYENDMDEIILEKAEQIKNKLKLLKALRK
jgi:deoxyhypusine synthase